MTYENYIEETTNNCMKVLSDCSAGELLEVEHLRTLLWDKDVLFDEQFLADFNERGMNMQEIMAYGAEAIDVVARCLALKHISILQLVEKEQRRRIERDRQKRNNSVRA